MSESTLTLSAANYQAVIGFRRGYGRTSGNWSTAQSNHVTELFERALRGFYWPENGYDWTFLHPITSFNTIVGQRLYGLPDDFGSIEGDITWKTEISGGIPIKRVDEEDVRRVRQGVTMTNGRPAWFAVLPAAPSGTVSTRWNLEFERPFDAVYVLEYQYRVLPGTISSTSVPYGGAAHAETLMAACLAAVEADMTQGEGVERARFVARLAASIAYDSRLKSPRVGAYGDMSAEDSKKNDLMSSLI